MPQGAQEADRWDNLRDLEEKMEGEVLAKPKGSLKAFVSRFGVDFWNQRLNPSEDPRLGYIVMER